MKIKSDRLQQLIKEEMQKIKEMYSLTKQHPLGSPEVADEIGNNKCDSPAAMLDEETLNGMVHSIVSEDEMNNVDLSQIIHKWRKDFERFKIDMASLKQDNLNEDGTAMSAGAVEGGGIYGAWAFPGEKERAKKYRQSKNT